MKRSTLGACVAGLSFAVIVFFLYVHQRYLLPSRLLIVSVSEYDAAGNSLDPSVVLAFKTAGSVVLSPDNSSNPGHVEDDGTERRLLQDENNVMADPTSTGSREAVRVTGFPKFLVTDMSAKTNNRQGSEQQAGAGRVSTQTQYNRAHSELESADSRSSTAVEESAGMKVGDEKPDLTVSKSAEMHEHVKYLELAKEGTNRTVAEISLNPDIVARGKFQRVQMEQFCVRTNQPSTLPTEASDRVSLLKHLLYDDSKRLVFCYVPKNGCSNLKHMMLILQGELPPSSVNKRPPEATLKKVNSLFTLDQDGIAYRLKHYYKMVILRNPIQRLVSAYRNKIEPPFNFTNKGRFPDVFKREMLKRYRSKEFQQYGALVNQKRTPKDPLIVSFHEFAQYMTLQPLNTYNEHFQPVLELCHPCAIKYDFYASFNAIDYDVYAIMHYLNISSSYYPTRISHPRVQTDDYLSGYFSKLPETDRNRLLTTFEDEMAFYYSVYPEGKSMGPGV